MNQHFYVNPVQWMRTDEAKAANFDPQPIYGTEQAGAFDLRICSVELSGSGWTNNGVTDVCDGGLITIHTGIKVWIDKPQIQLVESDSIDSAFHMPYNYLGIVAVRSSLGKRGLRLMNSVAFIDSDYQGEIVLVAQHTLHQSGPLTLTRGDRVAQMAIVPVLTPKLIQVEQFSGATERGTGGFGSSGR